MIKYKIIIVAMLFLGLGFIIPLSLNGISLHINLLLLVSGSADLS